MKTAFHISFKKLALLLSVVFSICGVQALAQGTTGSTTSGSEIVVYVLGWTIAIILIAAFLIIKRAAKVLNENGQSLFDIEFPSFRSMAGSGISVAVIMGLIILLGMYFVITYGS